MSSDPESADNSKSRAYALRSHKHEDQPLLEEWAKNYFTDWSSVGKVHKIHRKQVLPKEEQEFLSQNGFWFVKPLGTGGFGTVWLCMCERLVRHPNGNFIKAYMACKVVSIKTFKKSVVDVAVTKLLTEGKIHNQLTHENIVICEDVLYVSQPKTGFPFMRALLFMELCDKTLKEELQDRLVGHMSEREAHSWFVQIVRGLEYMHDQNIVHFDIKPKNILYKKTEQGGLVWKLSDFGLSQQYGSDEEARETQRRGVLKYVPPEAPSPFVRDANAQPYAAKPADVWALGVCLAESIVGLDKEFDFLEKCSQMRNRQDLWRMYGVSLVCGDFLWRIHYSDPKYRLTVHTIQSHQWFTKY